MRELDFHLNLTKVWTIDYVLLQSQSMLSYIYHVGHISTPIPVSGATQDTRTTLTQSAGMLEVVIVYFYTWNHSFLIKFITIIIISF